MQPVTLPSAVFNQLAERMRSGTLELPVLPDVAAQVVRMSGDDQTDARKLATLITRDQALAGNLLRLANSPLYSTGSPIVSLQQAVARLGLGRIREIALVISCQSSVFRVPGHEALVKHQFQHALAAAAFAQEIARAKRLNQEEAFLGGLLHDVGRVVLLQVLVDLHRSCDCCLVPAAVAGVVDKLHAIVGGQLVGSWTLPARLAESILHHHDPSSAPTAAELATLIAFADDCAHWALGGDALHGARPLTDDDLRGHPLLGELNLYPEDLDALLARRDAILATMQAVAG